MNEFNWEMKTIIMEYISYLTRYDEDLKTLIEDVNYSQPTLDRYHKEREDIRNYINHWMLWIQYVDGQPKIKAG